jgi:nitrite reductase (NADH) small subunit
MRVFDIDARSIGVVWTGERFFGVLNVCPHELAPVCEGALSGTMRPCQPGDPVYALDRQILRCPWHGYEFDLSNGGRAVSSEYRGRLRLFEVTVDDGQVYVELRGSRR